jgi:uncharacterized protein YfaS (alpha-2-macroglobulin family)
MSGLAWVTTLDDGKPVANAKVAVRSCDGELLGEGATDATGVARFAKLPDRRYKDCANGMDGYFVSARIAADHPQARGKADMAFVMSDWNRGIETWRFNVPTDLSPNQTVRAHTDLRSHAAARGRNGVDEAPDPHGDRAGIRAACRDAGQGGHHARR